MTHRARKLIWFYRYFRKSRYHQLDRFLAMRNAWWYAGRRQN